MKEFDYAIELNNLEERLSSVQSELDGFDEKPHSIVIKTIKGKSYYYEEWREDGRLCYKSLGMVSPGVIAQKEQKKLRYRKLIIERDELEYRIEQQRKILEAYKRHLSQKSILDDYIFEVYWKNDISSRVSVRGSKVRINRIINHPVRQIFSSNEITRNKLNEILELRCFDRHRPDAQKKLEALGLTEYRPIDIIRKTHGVSYNDYIWFRFMGEELRAEDVLVRSV